MGRKKKKNQGLGEYLPSKEETDAYRHGVNNGIRISARPATRGSNPTAWHVDVFSNGRWVKSPETYDKIEISRQIYKAYDYYYQKAKKKEE